MCLFIIPKLLRPYDALQLRVKMGEEIGVAEQEPIEEENVIDFHDIEHRQEAGKATQEIIILFYPIPRARLASAAFVMACISRAPISRVGHSG